ncbi:basic proline-rich protein-like [Phyllostomus hastatus]|uniref:basic proline-rich protein-like n=1 Tax=Phyllostomus hastatus TaxID=9423 RepID=UPI001E68485A|nr:basic proline-rich protein-like [Phyllostomus hastatus]
MRRTPVPPARPRGRASVTPSTPPRALAPGEGLGAPVLVRALWAWGPDRQPPRQGSAGNRLSSPERHRLLLNHAVGACPECQSMSKCNSGKGAGPAVLRSTAPAEPAPSPPRRDPGARPPPAGARPGTPPPRPKGPQLPPNFSPVNGGAQGRSQGRAGRSPAGAGRQPFNPETALAGREHERPEAHRPEKPGLPQTLEPRGLGARASALPGGSRRDLPTYLDPRPPRALPAARRPRQPGCVCLPPPRSCCRRLGRSSRLGAGPRWRAGGGLAEQLMSSQPGPAPTPRLRPRAPTTLVLLRRLCTHAQRPAPTPRQNTRPLRAPPPCSHAPPDPLPHAAHAGPRSASRVPVSCGPPRFPCPRPTTDAPRRAKALRARVCLACRARGGGAGGPRAACRRREASGAHSCPGSAGVKGGDGTQPRAGTAVAGGVFRKARRHDLQTARQLRAERAP